MPVLGEVLLNPVDTVLEGFASSHLGQHLVVEVLYSPILSPDLFYEQVHLPLSLQLVGHYSLLQLVYPPLQDHYLSVLLERVRVVE